MAGLTDLLGSLLQSGMASQASTRLGNVFGAGGSGGALSDIIGGLGQMMGGAGQAGSGGAVAGSASASAGPSAGGSGGGLGGMLGGVLGGLGQMMGGAGQAGSGGAVAGSASASAGPSAGGLGGMLGGVLGGLANNQAALGSLGALAGAILGGGGRATRGAIGGGALAMLASLAVSALKNAGQTPSQTPSALVNDPAPHQQAEMEADAMIIIKAMINAAKADGNIDQQEIEKITGKLAEDGLQEEEKQFLLAEAAKPLDTQELIAATQGRPELAAQIYAASLLTIDVGTPQNADYMRGLAAGLGLSPQVTQHIEQTFGVSRV